MRGIVKRFPGVLANDHVDFDVNAGEIHALLGANVLAFLERHRAAASPSKNHVHHGNIGDT